MEGRDSSDGACGGRGVTARNDPAAELRKAADSPHCTDGPGEFQTVEKHCRFSVRHFAPSNSGTAVPSMLAQSVRPPDGLVSRRSLRGALVRRRLAREIRRDDLRILTTETLNIIRIV